MDSIQKKNWFSVSLAAALLSALVLVALPLAAADNDSHVSTVFSGAKVNSGTVTHSKQGGMNILTLSDDFEKPGTPDPHWQVIDAKGRVYLLHRLDIKDDKFNKSITLPSYITNVAKVQIWCAWAEANLGEASFKKPVG